MAFGQFPSILDVLVFDNGDNPRYIKFTPSSNQELEYFQVETYAQGQLTGSIRLNFYSSFDQVTPVFTTEWVNIADLTSSTQNRLTRVVFELDKDNMSVNSSYTVQAETTGYTRNGDTDYLSMVLQRPDEPNLNLNNANWDLLEKPGTMKIYARV
jgi:hypothetical protein